MKKFIMLLVILMLCGCSGTVPKPTLMPTPTPTGVVVPESRIQEILTILNSSDLATATLDQDSKYFVLVPSNIDDEWRTIMSEVAKGNSEFTESWDALVSEYAALSISIYEKAPGYGLAFGNPYNSNNYLLAVLNGRIIYDFATSK